MIRNVLEQNGRLEIFLIGYGYFDLLQFLLPGPTRTRVVARIEKHVMAGIHARANKTENVSVIAHSFGTYAMTRILDENRHIELNHLILCGAIVPHNYDWGAARRQVSGRIVNDHGTRDPWPVLAQSVTWGYGDTGAYGVKVPQIDDRAHDVGHSGFHERSFVSRYWLPLLERGELAKAPDAQPAPWWFVILGLPWKWPIIAGLLLMALALLQPQLVSDQLAAMRIRFHQLLGLQTDSRDVPIRTLLSVACQIDLTPPPPEELAELERLTTFLKTDAWLGPAFGELGQTEIPGAGHNDRILSYNDSAGPTYNFSNDDEPWNGQFVNWALRQGGYEGIDASGVAREWLAFGQSAAASVGDYVEGAVVVLPRPEQPSGGVAGFYLGLDHQNPEAIRMLGGNLCGAVNVISVPAQMVLDYRLPSNWRGPAQ